MLAHSTVCPVCIETSRPEVLCYLQLLETTKPFLMNLVRLPALQTSLLFGRSSTDEAMKFGRTCYAAASLASMVPIDRLV